jgi:large conductance mechanosensitive channel
MMQALLKVLDEFKAFALRGNVVDMAVGIVIGAAFTTIVNSLVKDIIMPPIGVLTHGVDFSQLVIPLTAATPGHPAVGIGIGAFVNAVISFVIVAWALFMLIKGMNMLKAKEEAKPAAAAAVPPDVALLQEIRDLLAKQRAA